ncbi:hypothetical protein ASZ90_011357 [hydrocarbon metagenome]|uniref:Uncharacterized protein n=1 Tax=hydrocarbon metagenome TaxID=938273 RepID=A0A0W8FDL4_9ZZZZ
MTVPLRPPGIAGLLRPGFAVGLVAEEPRPPGRAVGRLVGELHGQGCGAGGRRADKRCFRSRRGRDRDVIGLAYAVVSVVVVYLQRYRVGARSGIDVRRVLVSRSHGIELPHVVAVGRYAAGALTAHEQYTPVRHRDAGVAASCRPPGTWKLRPRCAAVGRPPYVVQRGVVSILTAHEYDAAVRHRDAGVATSRRPPGTRGRQYPRRAAIFRSPHVVQWVSAIVQAAREYDVAVRRHDAGVMVPCRPPGNRVHACPVFAAVDRPPHVARRVAVITAHEYDGVAYRDRRMAVPLRPQGTRVHLIPCRAAIGRPPDVMQIVDIITTAHEYDAPVRHHDAGVPLSCRPYGANVHRCPRYAVIFRPPHIAIIVIAVKTAHEYDTAVRHRGAGVPLTSRPFRTPVHLRPCLIVRLVAEEPCPAVRIAGRLVGELCDQGCGAGGRRDAEAC